MQKYEEILAKNSPNFSKEMNLQTQETQWTPKKDKIRPTRRHIINCQKTTNYESSKKWPIIYNGASVRLTANFSKKL